MTNDLVARWANLLVDYCLRVEPGETILIASELAARPLVEACFRAVVDRGAHPVVRVELPGLGEYFVGHATEAQLTHLSPTAVREAEVVDGRIRIAAETDTRSMSGIDPARQAMVDRARAPLRELASKKRWVLTQYPTEAYARDASMPLADYSAYVAAAMFLDTPDPVAAWQELGRRQGGLVNFMTGVRDVRIEGEGTDLTLSVAGRTWINSDGRRNMPSGEIFTGPVETSARGKLRCSFPVCRGGREVGGIALQFDQGKVVAAHAESSAEYLHSMLDLDPGARYLGELGLGLNGGIDRFTGSILYDEKIGGTVHLALGNSYPETGGTNRSALHWDLIVDLRRGGRITADGQVVMETDDGWWAERSSPDREQNSIGRKLQNGLTLVKNVLRESVFQLPEPRGETMNRRRQTVVVVVVGFATLLGSARGWGQGTDSALKDRVAQLVERLGSPRQDTQMAAEKALITLGEKALPFLPTGGPQAARLDKIRQSVREIAEATTNLGASFVTLQAKGMRLTEAVKAIQAQTGNVINDLREANGEEATNPSVDLDLTARPFFEALDVVAEKAGVKITPYTGDGTIGLMTGGMMEPTPEMPARAKPLVVYSGPFRVEFKQFATVRDFNVANGTASAQFEVMWEPRLRPMLLGVRNEDLAITDDQGRTIAPQVKDQADETALRAGNCAAELNLALAAPERSASKLALVKVKGSVTVPSGMKLFRFPSLTAKEVTQKQGDISVTLESTDVDEQVWKVSLVVAYPEGGPAFASYRQGLFNNRLWLQKLDGSRFEQNGGYNNTGSDNRRIGFEYLFVDAPGKPGDHSLVYETPSKVVPIPLEFEFKDVPLP